VMITCGITRDSYMYEIFPGVTMSYRLDKTCRDYGLISNGIVEKLRHMLSC
jgi:hypothetical protein